MIAPPALVTVRLVGLPLDLHRRTQEHHDTLRRELAFVESAQVPQAAPAGLQALTGVLRQRFSSYTEAQTAALERAVAAGEATLDLEYEVPDDVATACEQLGAILDELDGFCRDGELLTLVSPPECVAYREWFLGQFVAQVRDGAEPIPWSAVAPAPAPVAGPPEVVGLGAPERLAVGGDLDLETAPALRGRILGALDQGHRRLEIDLDGCAFVDSTGLSLLLTTAQRCAEDGGWLRVVNAGGQVEELLDYAGVRELLAR